MLKLVRIEAPKIYLTVRFTELEAGTLATYELCLFVLLYLAFASVEFHASFQRFEGDLEGVFLFYFRWGFEENKELDQIH